jgi:hypothetical protein
VNHKPFILGKTVPLSTHREPGSRAEVELRVRNCRQGRGVLTCFGVVRAMRIAGQRLSSAPRRWKSHAMQDRNGLTSVVAWELSSRSPAKRMPLTNFRILTKADPGLSLEEMKQFVRNHFEDFVNRKKPEVAFKNFSSDFLDHDEPTGVEVGPEAAKTNDGSGLQALARSPCHGGGHSCGRRQSDGPQFMDGYRGGHRTEDRIPWIRLMAVCE